MMKRNRIGTTTVSLLMTLSAVAGLSGCNSKTTVQGGPGEGIHVEASGVRVDVGGGKGVQVDAPNTKVEVSDEKGVQVEAPNTEVNLGEKK